MAVSGQASKSSDSKRNARILKLLSTAVKSLGGSTRSGQEAMAQAVAGALANERHLAVQAGTGTGKSLAYLVPALDYALRNDTTVVISTATLALQNQLIERDLPALAQALEPVLTTPVTFAILKGRQNYLCERKRERLFAEDDSDALLDETQVSAIGAHALRLEEWAKTTETGDRDEIVPGVPNLVWSQASSTSQECVGAAICEFGVTCFAEQAREKAKHAALVVTNHAMLAIEALSDAKILPEHSAVIIDEAHELETRITSVATTELSMQALSLSAKRAKKLNALERAEKLVESAENWEAALLTLPPGRLTALPEHMQPTLTALQGCLWTLRDFIARVPSGEQTNDPDTHAERMALARHLLEQHDAIVSVLKIFHEPDITAHHDVVWVDHDERRGAVLKVAPLSVAGLLATNLFSENTVVLTSATLTLGGNFRAMAASWGIPTNSWDSLDAGSPFDPQRSGILYTPRHLPAPGRDGLHPETLEEIYHLIMAAGGRALGLFSSRRAAEEAADALRARLPFKIFLQGEDTTGTLIQQFRDQENSCLFGTLSLWQGVDVPGKSCSLVIMDKIPFPRPDDPLLQARKEAADQHGRNGFIEVAATHAALLMAQGAGRLLRRITDKGVVAVLDKRLVEQRYGKFLLDSMPRFWRTDDPDVVRGALKRLVQQ